MRQPPYRRPAQSAYAKGSWWAAHGAELGGAVVGFAVGFVVLMVVSAIEPSSEAGWIPVVTAIVGALTLRTVVRRQSR